MMINEKQLTRISKFLSLILRHRPELIGIQIDNNGWVDVKELINKSKEYGVSFDKEILNHIVLTNSKKRFVYNESFKKIRASQGHSIDVDLCFRNLRPPEILYHGTNVDSVNSILNDGIKKQNRQFVHLSIDYGTAINIGKRHGEPKVFMVLAQKMYLNNFQFYISENGVWLTEFVPSNFLRLID